MIAYASRTGNVRYIVSRLQLPAFEIEENRTFSNPYLLFTYTDGLGEVPGKVKRFLEQNGNYCRGVIVSGNSNFGHQVFGAAGDAIAAELQIPLIRKVDMRGFSDDYAAIQDFYEQCFGKERVG